CHKAATVIPGPQAASLHSAAACRRNLCSAGCRTPQASCLRSPAKIENASLIARRWLYGNLDLVTLGEFNGTRITGISMAKNAHARIAGKDALQTTLGIFGSIRNHDHAGMLGIPDADAPAALNRDPGGARGGVDNRIKQRPVSDGITAIDHSFRLAKR